MSCSPEVLNFMEQCYADEAREKKELYAALTARTERIEELEKELNDYQCFMDAVVDCFSDGDELSDLLSWMSENREQYKNMKWYEELVCFP